MLLESFLEASAARHPDKTALISGPRRVTYAELETMANQMAHGLIAAGVSRGDRVAICLPTGVEAVVALFASAKAGAVFVMVNPAARGPRLPFYLSDTRARVRVTDARR